MVENRIFTDLYFLRACHDFAKLGFTLLNPVYEGIFFDT